jgi:RNA polymerase sigma factor (TIGR02999 family)
VERQVQPSNVLRDGSDAEREALLAAVYDELRRAARRLLRRQSSQLTLEPTELVNDAVLKVMQLDRMTFNDPQHMFAVCSRLLRQVMVDAIRKRSRQKRSAPQATLVTDRGGQSFDVMRLDMALNDLEQVSPEMARIVELRFFVGLSIEEVAGVLAQSESTVKRRWQAARLWLADALEPEGGAGDNGGYNEGSDAR